MKSLISLSMHKAGSSIADLIVVDFCRHKGYELDRISKQVSASPLPEGDVFINYQDSMKLEGVYYGMARGHYVKDMDVIDKLKVIVQVRDPRDCLTSAYFSFKESHVPPQNPSKLEEFQNRRDTISQMTIDEYAASRAKNYRMRMNVLREIIERHDDVVLLKYEDMVERTDYWLYQISEFLGQPLTASLKESIEDKVNFRVASEDSARHKRQVKPGDHRRKLESSTIASMNATLAEPLKYFGYDVGVG